MRGILSVLLIVLAGFATAQSYPEPSELSVNDFAGIIGDEAEERLTKTLDALREETEVELVVLTLSRQDMFAPDLSLKEFGRGIFDEWGIGNKKRDDGILVLVLRADQAMRITLGKGYGNKADKAADKSVDRSFLPSFKDGNYEQGIETGVDDLIANLVRPHVAKLVEDGVITAAADDTGSSDAASSDAASTSSDSAASDTASSTTSSEQASSTASSPPKEDGKGGGLSILLWIGGGIAALIAFFTFKSKTRKCPSCGARGTLKTATNTLEHPTEERSGKGERITTCEKCDYRDVDTYTISKLEKKEPEPDPEPEPKDFSGGEAGKKGSTGKW